MCVLCVFLEKIKSKNYEKNLGTDFVRHTLVHTLKCTKLLHLSNVITMMLLCCLLLGHVMGQVMLKVIFCT